MDELELWEDIDGYKGYYQVSSLGNVTSLDRTIISIQPRYKLPRLIHRKGKVLKPAPTNKVKDGLCRYLRIVLCKDSKLKTYEIHRLVCLHFVPNPHNKPITNHINANTLDNRASNLEWCTVLENSQHSIRLGRAFWQKKHSNNTV
jgi:hypothetical protein